MMHDNVNKRPVMMLNIARTALFMCLLMNTLWAAPVSHAAHFPKRAELHYIGPYNAPVTMTFVRSGNRYDVTTNIDIPLYPMRFSSAGTVTGNTLQPATYDDNRLGISYAHADFSGNLVRYGKTTEPAKTAAINGPVFDVLTLAWQLAMNNTQLPANVRITNGKKIYAVSGMHKTGSGKYTLGKSTISISHYRVQRDDDTIDYSFAPALSNLPVQIAYTSDGQSYAMKLKSGYLDGKAIGGQ